MNKTPKKQISSTIIALLTGLLLFATAGSAMAITDMNGNNKQLQNMIGNGKWTVFEIWASDCPACPDAVFYMKNLKKRYGHKVELIGVSVDGDHGDKGKAMATAFMKKHQITFPTLLGRTVEVDNFLYGFEEDLYGTPSLLLFNPKGELRGIEVGAIISQDVIDFIEQDEAK
uniref:Thiol-disulfide isomerase or thioredoxin n=1 Tax=uncultured Thiotrichaceae bacterium TaxID=298394 RepID=A0A6S6TLU2_9GAMM|nr:MAG: Thiol-disulfide isomerase or thioredoxin [uncultured Thiotrichaceae bacterium]